MKLVNHGIPLDEFPYRVFDVLTLLGHEGFDFRRHQLTLDFWIKEISMTQGPDPNGSSVTLTTARILIVESKGHESEIYELEAFWQEWGQDKDGKGGFGCYGLNGPMHEMKSFKK